MTLLTILLTCLILSNIIYLIDSILIIHQIYFKYISFTISKITDLIIALIYLLSITTFFIRYYYNQNIILNRSNEFSINSINQLENIVYFSLINLCIFSFTKSYLVKRLTLKLQKAFSFMNNFYKFMKYNNIIVKKLKCNTKPIFQVLYCIILL